jgi:uncharacterized cupredoxin-like copper-binding protein
VVVVAAAACGGGNRTAQGEQIARVTEKDFAITAPKRLRAGEIRLVAENEGPDTHELIVVRDDGRLLPLRTDGLTVDEETLEPRIAAVLEGYAPKAERSVTLRLQPGRYTLFCNMAGHYLGGMHRELVVQ